MVSNPGRGNVAPGTRRVNAGWRGMISNYGKVLTSTCHTSNDDELHERVHAHIRNYR